MRILMATDGSVHASSAMLAASRLLRIDKADVDLLCVAPQPASAAKGVDSRLHGAYEQELSLPTRRILEEAERILRHSHITARGLWRSGSTAETILAAAKDYDLTVVGAYGNHDRKQPGLGPVSSQLLQASTGNLMIGRELLNEDNFRVLVAVDGSDASLRGVHMLRTLFDSTRMEVTLIHVMEMFWVADDTSSPEMSRYHQQLRRELRHTAHEILANAQRELELSGIPSTQITKEGDAALELCSEADNGYDLIIAGATGASDIRHALMGRVSLKVAWEAPCSVAVTRHGI